MRTTWPIVEPPRGRPLAASASSSIRPERCPDREHAHDARRRPPRARRARRARRPLRRRRLARLPGGAPARHRQDRPRDDRRHPALAAPAARLVAALVEVAHEQGAASSPRASSASTSSRRCASSASTSARASTSASRPSKPMAVDPRLVRKRAESSENGPAGPPPECGDRRIPPGVTWPSARARPLRQLRADAARDGRAVRRRLRPRPGAAPPRRLLARRRRLLRGDPPRAVVRADLAGIDPRRARARDPRARAGPRRPPAPRRRATRSASTSSSRSSTGRSGASSRSAPRSTPTPPTPPTRTAS